VCVKTIFLKLYCESLFKQSEISLHLKGDNSTSTTGLDENNTTIYNVIMMKCYIYTGDTQNVEFFFILGFFGSPSVPAD